MSTASKLKVFVSSDFHADFWNNFDFTDKEAIFNEINLVPEENYDLIVLAGDISQCHNATAQGRYAKIIETICSLGVPVVLIKGNHENYQTNLSNSRFFLKSLSQERFSNLYFLEQEYIRLKIKEQDYVIFGATLWTNFNKLDPLAVFDANEKMNDFNAYIRNSTYTKFNAYDAFEIHNQTLDKIISCSQNLNGANFIVVTHHAPLLQASVNFRKLRNFGDSPDNLDYSYSSDLTKFISGLKNKPQYWIFGHIHAPYKDEYDGVKFISNPYGYPEDYEKRIYNNPTMILNFKE